MRQRADWALRPEPTAGIVRAYIEHGMHVRPGPLRLWMLGPMFRYDRPQAGRYRQFTQWDVEVLGDPGPMVDAELIELAHRFYAEAGISGRGGVPELDRRRDLPPRLSAGADRLLRQAHGPPVR